MQTITVVRSSSTTPVVPAAAPKEQPPVEAASGSVVKDILASESDPTKDGRPLPPKNQRVVQTLPTSLKDKVVTATCAGAGLWTLANIGMQIAGLPAGAAVLAGLGSAAVAATAWAVTDAGSGMFHFAVDNYGDPKTPVVGNMIKEFQEHHVKPWDLEEGSVWTNCAAAGQVLGPALMAVAYVNPHYLVQAAALSIMTAGYLAQASHRWAHMGDRAPKLAKGLQKLHVLQTKKQHDAHHAQPIGTYCIVNGMANPMFDKLNLWRKAEYVIYKATGVEPNTWLDPEVKKKALGIGDPADYIDPAKRQEGRREFWKGMLAKIDSWRADSAAEKPKEN